MSSTPISPIPARRARPGHGRRLRHRPRHRRALIGQGVRVHICDVSDEFLADFRAAHPQAGASRADVSSESDVARLFADLQAGLGGLDILVNNAGIAGPTGGVDEIAPADWRRTIDICLTGQFLCAPPCGADAQGGRRRLDRQHVLGRRAGSATPFARPIRRRSGASSALRRASPRSSARKTSG